MKRVLVVAGVMAVFGTYGIARGATTRPLQKAAASVVDFNGDGFADLAIGVPFEDVGSISNAGAFNVIYGSIDGLHSADNQFWNQASDNVEGDPNVGDEFGFSVATGDFNADGFTDLAVGVPFEDVGISADAGAVNVIYGSATGLDATFVPDQLWTQDSADVEDDAETSDQFGSSLTTGDFNGDGFADLAIGVVGEDLGTITDAGAVNVIYGSASGLSATTVPDQFWNQDSQGIQDLAETGDGFGKSLASADFNADGNDDLAVGVWLEDVGDVFDQVVDAGAVNVIYGSASGLAAARNQYWNQNTPRVSGESEPSDEFGAAVAAGDFSGDGFADLAVGVPDEDIGSISNAGAVNVLYGSTKGLGLNLNQFWSQDTTGIIDHAESSDTFGSALSAGDFDGDGFVDLVVGVPNEEVLRVNQAGMVNVIYGSSLGLSATDNQIWAQDSPGINGEGETADLFGFSVATGDYNGDGFVDMSAGVPLEGVDPLPDTGAVNTIYGSFAGLSPAGNQFWAQDTPGILDDGESNDQFGYAMA